MTTISPVASAVDRRSIENALEDLTEELIAGGLAADQAGADPATNLALISGTQAQSMNIPRKFGGIWDGAPFGNWADMIAVETRISSFDGPTGQNWGTTASVLRELMGDDVPLPEENKAEIAGRVLGENLRLCASNSETGSAQPVVARRVPGGVVLSGIKTFNTNSGGMGMASVGCPLEGEDGRYHVLVDLNDPGVKLHHDWDVMGQRGTYSQTVTYDDVFVADGWFYESHPLDPLYSSGAMMLHAGLMLGIGQGAMRATVDYLRRTNRKILPGATGSASDPLITSKLGSISVGLHAAQALLEKAASQLEDIGSQTNPSAVDRDAASIAGFRSKVACVEASLVACAEIFEFTGARGTASKYDLDRYWRNARTFASHDPTETKKTTVGAFEINGVMPGLHEFLRV